MRSSFKSGPIIKSHPFSENDYPTDFLELLFNSLLTQLLSVGNFSEKNQKEKDLCCYFVLLSLEVSEEHFFSVGR